MRRFWCTRKKSWSQPKAQLYISLSSEALAIPPGVNDIFLVHSIKQNLNSENIQIGPSTSFWALCLSRPEVVKAKQHKTGGNPGVPAKIQLFISLYFDVLDNLALLKDVSCFNTNDIKSASIQLCARLPVTAETNPSANPSSIPSWRPPLPRPWRGDGDGGFQHISAKLGPRSSPSRAVKDRNFLLRRRLSHTREWKRPHMRAIDELIIQGLEPSTLLDEA